MSIAAGLLALDAASRADKTAAGVSLPVARYDGPVTQPAGDAVMAGSGDSPYVPPADTGGTDDLQVRLERLPVNHPASPYCPDGKRKPPPPSLKDLEEPISGNPDGQAGDASASELAASSVAPAEASASGVFLKTDRAARQDRDVSVGEPAAGDAPTRSEVLGAEGATKSDTPAQQDSFRFTDEGYKEHVAEVRQCLDAAHGANLATELQFTIDGDHEVWAAEREELHNQIVNDLYSRATHVPSEYRAVIAGGLPGAGKSTTLREYAGIDRSQFIFIDPDEVKGELASRGLVPHIRGLSPMEATDLVHEESSHIAKLLAYRAQAEGKNIVWDITMSSENTAARRISGLHRDGYHHIEGIFVDIPAETSAARVAHRHRLNEERYRVGHGFGGRYVPDEVIKNKSDSDWGSINRRNFEELKPQFDKWSVYDNSVDGCSPELVESSYRKESH